MTTESDALPTGETIHRAAGGDGALSALQAARSLADTRYKEQAQAQRAAEAPAQEPPAAEPEKELAGEANAAPPEEATGETQEADPAAEPPLERPRSWSKDRQESWAKLDRETQEYLLDHDREASASVRKAQNEAAETSKALKAKEEAAEQVRQKFEQALPQLLQALHEQQQGEFADIKSVADVERLAREDWPRFSLWQAQQMKIAAVQAEVEKTNQRQAQEKATKWQSFANDEDAKFLKLAPEFTDKGTLEKGSKAAAELLRDLGFKDSDLGEMWNGQREVSLRDHRIQLLLRDAVKYREAQAAAKKVSAVPKPPVQRPGTAQAKATGVEAEIQALTKQLTGATAHQQARIAAKITTLRRSVAR